jgi:hypothetical protein
MWPMLRILRPGAVHTEPRCVILDAATEQRRHEAVKAQNKAMLAISPKS